MKTTAKIITETLMKELNNFYVSRTHREKKGLELAFAIILCTLLITTSIEPAVQTLLTKPQELINKKNQLAQALQLANEILTLQKNTKTIYNPNLETTINASLAAFSWQEKSQIKKLNNAQIEVRLENLPAVDALTWIDENERTHGLVLKQLELIKTSTGVVNLYTLWTASQ